MHHQLSVCWLLGYFLKDISCPAFPLNSNTCAGLIWVNVVYVVQTLLSSEGLTLWWSRPGFPSPGCRRSAAWRPRRTAWPSPAAGPTSGRHEAAGSRSSSATSERRGEKKRTWPSHLSLYVNEFHQTKCSLMRTFWISLTNWVSVCFVSETWTESCLWVWLWWCERAKNWTSLCCVTPESVKLMSSQTEMSHWWELGYFHWWRCPFFQYLQMLHIPKMCIT